MTWIESTVAAIAPALLPMPISPLWHRLSSNLLDASVTAAALGVVGRIFWQVTGFVGRSARFYLGQAVTQVRIGFDPPIGADHPIRRDLAAATFHCQIVRFGDDDYLQSLASEQERFEGRLQNRVLPVVMDCAACQGQVLLPVHRRLGTQFKLFLMAADDAAATRLMRTPVFLDPDRYARQRGRRISFVLPSIQKVGNVEKQSFNNIYYPSNLDDFAERNRFGTLYLAVQDWRFRWERRRRDAA